MRDSKQWWGMKSSRESAQTRALFCFPAAHCLPTLVHVPSPSLISPISLVLPIYPAFVPTPFVPYLSLHTGRSSAPSHRPLPAYPALVPTPFVPYLSLYTGHPPALSRRLLPAACLLSFLSPSSLALPHSHFHSLPCTLLPAPSVDTGRPPAPSHRPRLPEQWRGPQVRSWRVKVWDLEIPAHSTRCGSVGLETPCLHHTGNATMPLCRPRHSCLWMVFRHPIISHPRCSFLPKGTSGTP